MRDSMIFYRSFYEAINELPEQNQLAIYKAIFSFSLNFEEIELEGISKTVFRLIKPQLEANIKRYKNGKTPKAKQTGSKKEANRKQTGSKTGTNKNVNENVNENVFNFKNALIELGVDECVVRDWLKVRKTKKATNTETAFNSIKKEIKKGNYSANECIKMAAEKSWAGFKMEWYKNEINDESNGEQENYDFKIINS